MSKVNYLYSGSYQDQALFKMLEVLMDENLLLATPWQGNPDEFFFVRIQYEISNKKISLNENLVCGQVVYLDEKWEGSGLRVFPKRFDSRTEAMAYVDENLKESGWTLP